MASLILGGIGAAAGSAISGGVGARWGFSAGVLLAGALFPPRQKRQDRGPLDDLKLGGSQYGVAIPQVYGYGRVPGIIVWIGKDGEGNHLISHRHSGGKGQPPTYNYTATFAALICRGPIQSVRKIWANDKVVYDASKADPDGKNVIRTYLGTEAQIVDEAIETAEGVDQWTAYRGQAYAVFESFNLADFGNSLPNLSFEVGPEGATRQFDYRFEDSPGFLVDSSSFGRDLTGTAPVQVASGYSGEAMRTNANPVYCVTGSVAALQGTALTVQFAVRWDGVSFTSIDRFRYKDVTSGDLAWSFSFDWLSDQLTVSHEGPTGTHVFHVIAFTATTTWRLVRWTFLAGVDVSLYVDGVLIDQDVPSPTLTSLAISGGAAHRVEFTGDIITHAVWDEATAYASVTDDADVTVASILEDQFAQVGIDPSEYDVSAAEAQTVTGFLVGSRIDVRQADRELLMVTDLDLAEVDGQIVAVARGGASIVTLPESDLGAYLADGPPEGMDPPTRVEARRLPVSELPYRLDLEYLARTNNYQQAQATAIRFARVSETQEQLTVSTPLVMTEARARAAAEKLIYAQWIERNQAVVSVGPKYLHLAPGDIVTLPLAGTSIRKRVEQIDAEPFGCLRLTLAQDAAEILTQYQDGPLIDAPFEGLPEAATTTLVAWSGNAVTDANATDGQIGFYAGAGGPLGEDWPGAVLYWSRDGGATYEELSSFSDNATLGDADTALSAPPGGAYDLWDDTNVVDVEITSGDAPESTSDAAVLNGSNAAILGDEVIQFAVATALGANVYRLSRLLRGRRGTESFGGTHAIGDRFALLTDGKVRRVTVDPSLVGKTVTLKAVTVGATVASASPVSLTITGDELKPYAPTSVAGSRDGGNNLTVTWIGRTRAGGAWADLADVDQPEVTLAYEVDFLSGVTVVRTKSVTTELVTYSAAEQTTDTLTPGDPVSLVVYQLGKLGRGYGKPATV